MSEVSVLEPVTGVRGVERKTVAHTQETKAKIAAAMKQHFADPNARKRRSVALVRYWARLPEGARSGENWRPTRTTE